MRTLCVIIIVFLCAAGGAGAQERGLVRKGNELYTQKKYKEASAAYQQALKNQPLFVPGAFNLGNALIQQKQYDAARNVMANTAKTSKDPAVQSGAQYNTGNTYMSEQQWQQAVDAYKQALRKAPQDADAKYNLSYALARLKQQQQQQNSGGGKDDKKDQSKKDDKQDKKEDDKKDQQREGDQQKQQPRQSQPSKLSEQQADNLLKALQQDERKVQDKMQQSKATPVKMEKDW